MMMSDISESMTRPLVSFVVACYNIPVDMLRECIDSILAVALSDEEREIVLVDDGSTVDYSRLVQSYADRVVFVSQRNGGLSLARNAGTERCRGEYIQLVDGDDRLLTAGYDACLEILRRHRPDILFFHLSENGKTHRAARCAKYAATDYMRRHNLRSSACGYLFRREVQGDLRFTAGLLHEDVEFTPLLTLRADVVMESGRTAYYYRRRESSITHRDDAPHIKKRLDDREWILTRLKEHAATLKSEATAALDRVVAQYSMDYLYNIVKLSTFDDLLRRVERLRERRLYPLPLKYHTLKYFLFAVATSRRTGLRLLFGFFKRQGGCQARR